MSTNRDKILEAAQKYVEKKRYDRAVAELKKLIDVDPNDARTLLKIGDLQAKQMLFPDAISTYEAVGRLYAAQGFALKAIAVYKQIRELIARHVPQLEDHYAHIAPRLAELYHQLGLTSDALATLDEVATRLQRQQRIHEAIDVLRRLASLDPLNPLPHLRLAEALSGVQDIEGAVAEFATAASQLAGIGRRDDAIKVLERLLFHKNDPDQARFCAELYLSRNQPQDGMMALAKLQVCFQASPHDLGTLALLARAFNSLGQVDKAIEVQKEIARLARDAGNAQLFRDVVNHLSLIAPLDDEVRVLREQSMAVAKPQSIVEELSESAYLEEIEDIELVEDVEPPPKAATAPAPANRAAPQAELFEQTKSLLEDANAFRQARLYVNALAVLRAGLDADPRSMELHEVYRDVLIESGATAAAVEEMLTIARIYVEASDTESAVLALQDVLAFDPKSAPALQLLAELGYEVVDDASASGDEQLGSHQGALSARGGASADVEEALPSFPLDDVDSIGRMPSAAPAGTGVDLESALAEAEFFCSRGMLTDARAILEEQRSQHPNHPLILARLNDLQALEEQARAVLASGTSHDSIPSFGAATALDALESLEYTEGEPALGTPKEDAIDVEELFAQFKQGVSSKIDVEDADSHYNLGIAYREMMLFDDAIREFDLAARDPKLECVARSLIGMMELERGRTKLAIESFRKGLDAGVKDAAQETVLCFEIGAAYESDHEQAQALAFYERAMRLDPDYRDVKERVRRLSKYRSSEAAKQAAASTDDEFDRAFDDLLGKG